MNKKKLNLAPVQDMSELLEIKNKKDNVTFVPLDFSSLLFCKHKKLNFIEPKDFLNNEIHRKGILSHVKIKKSLENSFKYNDQKKQFSIFQCYGHNAFFFVKYFFSQIEKKYNINKIYLSGWRKPVNDVEGEYYSLLDIFSSFKKYKIVLINKKEIKFEEKLFNYSISEKLNTSKKAVFFTDTGYNFRNIILKYIFSNYSCFILTRKKVNVFKIFFSKLINIRYLSLKKQKIAIKKNNKIKIRLFKGFKDYENYLNTRANHYLGVLENLQRKCGVIKKILNKIKPVKIFLNHCVSYNSFIIDYSKKNKVPLTLIGHGTLSKGRNKFEKNYNDIIANAIHSKMVTTYPIQSKIINEYLKNHHSYKKPKGNIVFSQIKRQKSNYIFYAVTLKNFSNMIFYGQELYYEYFENLKFLNELAKENNLKICVKHHPNYLFTNELSSIFFKNLKFLDEPIKDILKNTEILLSFSSSSIEDALSSKVPVVLFDPWSRYKHCKAEENFKKKNRCLYYINKKENLNKVIDTIRSNDKISFSDYVYSTSIKNNIKNLINEKSK